MHNRCKFITALVFFTLLFYALPLKASKTGTWEYYRTHFISKDGRVIDFYNGSISHSEGQGYGMVLSALYNDKNTFELVYKWTKDNLMVRHDNLTVWKWGRRINGRWGVVDYNNATDGDILISWALLKAYEKWKNVNHRSHALKIIESIKKNLIIIHKNHKLFIPGYFGFNTDKIIIVNPSYYVYPALLDFAKYDEPDFWNTMVSKGLELTFDSLYTRMRLPADWLKIDENNTVSVNKERSHDFGYEAIRIPLYAILAGRSRNLISFMPYIKLIRKIGYVPVKVDLIEHKISIDEAPGGFYAVFALIAKELHLTKYSQRLFLQARIRLSKEDKDYYSHTLFLLSNRVF